MDYYVTIGKWREMKGYSIKEAASRLEVSKNTLLFYESNPKKTPLHIIAIINNF